VTRLQIAIAFSILALGAVVANGQDHSDPPSAPHQTARRSQGFLDYTLGKINPANRDYGLSAADLRAEAVHDSIDDLYFWSNLVTLSLLASITVIRVLEHRAAEKKEVICVTLITQLWNGRVSDLIEVERRTNQYNALAERNNLEVERGLMTSVKGADADETSSSKIKQTVEKLERRNTPAQSTPPSKPLVGPASQSNDASLSPPASIDPTQKTLLLERQIEAMRNTEQNLKERLNQTTFQLEKERQRNATLKGA
jgi:hypothetical protein